MNPEQGHFKLLFCPQGENVDFNPVCSECPTLPTICKYLHIGTGMGKGQCDADTMEFRKSDAILILLSWLWCLGQVTYFLSHKCKIVDGPSQDFSVDNSGEWISSTCGGLTGVKYIGSIVHTSFPLSWKLDNVPVEWCNLVKLNLSNSKWHVSCHPDLTHSLI